MRRFNRSIVAFFLLLSFAQGISMRLWMHSWFHTGKSASAVQLPSGDDSRLKCDCLQDASMPLQGAHNFELQVPVNTFVSQYRLADIVFSSAGRLFCSLKGPPGMLIPDVNSIV